MFIIESEFYELYFIIIIKLIKSNKILSKIDGCKIHMEFHIKLTQYQNIPLVIQKCVKFSLK